MISLDSLTIRRIRLETEQSTMKFIDTLKGLTLTKQLTVAGAVACVVLLMTFMIQGAMREPMSLLYSGLDPARSGEVIEELEQRNVAYEIRGGSIFVAQSSRDKIRFALAKEGLPRQTVQGYELLDDVNGFSITSEMYKASYWRAKEGELTRTILSIPWVESARVHIGANLRSGFSRNRATQTASVALSTSHAISRKQAESIQYLVALAVSGLNPEDVVVVDSARGILAGPNVDRADQPDFVAQTQAGLLEQKVLNLLEARVGAGNARVSASVDVTRESRRTSEVKYDPLSRVLRNRTVNESTESRQGGAGAALTVASNLPQGQGLGGTPGTSESSTSTETASYEVNETRTETELLPGDVERVSIAVLLNEDAFGIDLAAADASAQVQQLIDEVQQLVSSGIGLDIDRGDSITVEMMPFVDLVTPELALAPSFLQQMFEKHFWSIAQAFLLGVVVIVLGLGVVKPILTQRQAVPNTDADIGADVVPGDDGDPHQEGDPFDYLRDYTKSREAETAALLQEWLVDHEKVAVNE